jgi:hypothetical protein
MTGSRCSGFRLLPATNCAAISRTVFAMLRGRNADSTRHGASSSRKSLSEGRPWLGYVRVWSESPTLTPIYSEGAASQGLSSKAGFSVMNRTTAIANTAMALGAPVFA